MNKFQWNWNQIIINFILESAFENVVCEMRTILSRPQLRTNEGKQPPYAFSCDLNDHFRI